MKRIKYYSIIQSNKYPDLRSVYPIVNMMVDDNGDLTGQTLLEGYHTPEQLNEIESVGGVNYTHDEYITARSSQ
ncbi:hypothetical protein [Pontibacter kalidii]|uniref:hypothetical protein n=1 Tax=Pontibacter kalidii TaxID=2592049 RepID=UPI00225BC3F2|nr:hypothetical protein [Pontibacter kalidii]